MNAREHALIARRLITKCGGLREAARACRLKRARLAHFQDPNAGAYMPADVINALELYCGEAVYSRALADDRPTDSAGESLADEACDLAEEATVLQRQVRVLARTGALTPRQKGDVIAEALKLRDEINKLIATAEGE